MKEILWSKVIQEYRDHITNHNLRNKTAKQLQEENIGSCRTCYLAKGSPPIAFLTFFSVACRNLLAQSYTSRTVTLFKQVLANLRKERELTGGIIEIINELLTTLVYKYPPTLTERGAAIFIGTLISPLGTPNIEPQTPKGENIKDLLRNKPLQRNLCKIYSKEPLILDLDLIGRKTHLPDHLVNEFQYY